MPVLLHQQPVLTLALDSFQDTTIDESDIRRMWIIFTKCKDDIKNGFRLENISWRIWYKKYLNNTTDLFSNNKIYNKKSVSGSQHGGSMVHSVESSNSSFSTIEPIEVLKKCACGEQLISTSLSSLSTPHSEYTCFDKQICQHHHSSSKQNNTRTTTTPPPIQEEEEESNKETSITENQDTTTTPIDTTTEETVVEVPKEPKESEPEPKPESSNVPEVVAKDEKESSLEGKKEEAVVANVEQTTTQHTNSSSTDANQTINNGQTNTSTTIPPNCPTMEQFYQQQLLLLQQVYIQKQQQLQYQKQQMNGNPEQIYQQQMYLQQWFNQQQQQLLANCSHYYKKYLQQHFGIGVVEPQPQPTHRLQEEYDDEDEEDEEDDDDFYSDEEDDDFNDDEDEEDDYEDDIEEEIPVPEPKKDDLFRKVSTPTLKNKMAKPSLLSAMIKENNYNEYKKTVEIIRKYDDDAQKSSNNIYSIKDYNRNCINSLNKNVRRKRAPSFEDVRNARKLFEMHPLYQQDPTVVSESGRDDVEEYYERGHSHQNTTTTGNPNSYSTVNTMASQDSHCTVYSNHSHLGVYGSNKTTHSAYSTKSQTITGNRASNNNSVNLYLNKKRMNYSN
ncbi:hypothetical protein PIROE2DRAFT_16174 [Piromyces sp. E2]|nr:hypothetical protein PIROE2DRAFT_16174 [Piromyces sp. E2]|eukprot:OUM58512.1 hypothetical protein PIROE2DRAFT_16174 [Piromyces sp. E2]